MHPDTDTILIDSDKESSQIISQKLSKAGFKIHECHSLAETAAVIHQAKIILLTLDPETISEHLEMTKKIAAIRNIPVLFISGNMAPELLDQISNFPAYGVISKASAKEVMAASIKIALDLHLKSSGPKTIPENTIPASSGIMIMDYECRVVFASRSMGAIFNASDDSMMGHILGTAIRCINSRSNENGCGYLESCNNCTLRASVENTLYARSMPEVHEIEKYLYIDGEMKKRKFRIQTEPVEMNHIIHCILTLEDLGPIVESTVPLGV